MGRKGVSKPKRAKEKKKAAQVSGSHSVSGGRNVENQPEQVTEKSMAWTKDNKKR
jgi:hypothetical protein